VHARRTDDGPAAATNEAPAVAFDGVGKRFGIATVLAGVGFEVRAGRVLGLVGENGAGKSTLMNILGGTVTPDAGVIRLAGRDYRPLSPADARAAGIAFVHQELNLFANLTIAENLHLDAFPRKAGRPWIDRPAMRERTRVLLERVGLAISPDTRVERLSAGERQLVEIARALGAEARVLILDEPTSSLSAVERERLFELVRALVTGARPLAAIFISHDLADVLSLCHDIVVLRDGAVVASGEAAEFGIDRLVTLMVGREITQLFPERPEPAAPDTPLLDVRGVTQRGVVRDVSFTVGHGEIVGIAGLMGAGRSELARILFGLDPCEAGDVRVEGRPVSGGPRRRIARGLALVTDDRRGDGLLVAASLADNLALVALPSLCRTPLRLVDAGRVSALVHDLRASVRLTAAAADSQPVGMLSGGNQQKVVLARWLPARPRVLILDEPTRGVDVGARAEIYRLLAAHAAGGACVLAISSDIEELAGLCDRILVMRQGEIALDCVRREFDRKRLLAAALPPERRP
jgi:ribose transport system ATP-binding protein